MLIEVYLGLYRHRKNVWVLGCDSISVHAKIESLQSP